MDPVLSSIPIFKNLEEEVKNLDTAINNKKIAIKESQALITKYTEQQINQKGKCSVIEQ